MTDPKAVRIEPWDTGDFRLLKKIMGDPAMTEHLGGPENPEKLLERQTRYERLADSGKGRMFRIMLNVTDEAIGSVGYWTREWRNEQIFEIGWSVIPAFQRRGFASMATAHAISRARSERQHRFLHAFPSIDNPPSNAICRELGFTLLEQCEFEYPPGRFMQCNDWRFDLLVRK